MSNQQPEEPPYGHCVVANVAGQTTHGRGGLDLQRGLKHFAPGAKLWIAPPRWDLGGGQVVVAGRHRDNSRRYVTLVTDMRHLENFRSQEVFSPALLRALTRQGPGEPRGLWTAERAEEFATHHNVPRLEVRLDGHYTAALATVPEPPPMELEHDGRTYYLAHLNANSARYSSLPPPEEPACR
ncbi:hypothetical protein ACFV4F_42725 [Kitasatospora sp. NPDC059722]|uniref:hypothetical protein n=1 Tax=unclassified Kitasatospora TaxID=2633591 RepID=UPI00365D48C2